MKYHSYLEAVCKLQEFVGNIYQRHADLREIRMAGALLYETQGQIPIRELAARSPLSLSQLERRFKRLTGVTLKQFARLIRFQMARNKIHSEPTLRLVDLAYDLGYADQAHFTNDFRTFADRSPGNYLNQLRTNSTENADFLQDP